MQKKHVSPEFTVIKQNEANAKFFVASFVSGEQGSTTSTQATQYVEETQTDNSTVGQDGGFTF